MGRQVGGKLETAEVDVDRGTVQTKDSRGEVAGEEHAADALPTQMYMQMHGGGGPLTPSEVHAHARAGVSGPGGPLPHRKQIQASFGRHDVGKIQAHMDMAAKKSTASIGAKAFATGEHVAFSSRPSVFIAAHEAAHVVQQRGGVQLFGGIGKVGDRHEQHADTVAREVVAGRSAEKLLDQYTGPASPGVQRSESLQFWGEPDHYIMGQEAGKIVYDKLDSMPLIKTDFKLGPKEVDPSKKKSFKPDGKDIVESDDTRRFMVRGRKGKGMSYGAANRFAGDLSPRATGKSTRGPSLEDWTDKVDEKGSDYLKLGEFGEYTLLGTNANHFYPLAAVEYRRNHAIAKQKMWMALEVRKNSTSSDDAELATELARQAIVLEGFASHFLADCFAAGHLSPHALGRIGEKVGRSGPLVNTWHDLLNALPMGVPTTLGRFHGDYSMDGNDLAYMSNVIANSLLEIAMPWYTGKYFQPTLRLPKPDLTAIRKDPVVGPIWAQMCGDYKAAMKLQLDRDRRRGKKGLSKYAIYQTTGDHQVSQEETIAPILADVFGGTLDGPERIDDTEGSVAKIRGKVHALLTALHQVMAYKGGWQTEAGITQGYEDTDYDSQSTYKFRTDFKSAKLAWISPASAPILSLCDEVMYWVGRWDLHLTIEDTKIEEELREELADLAEAMKKGAKKHEDKTRAGFISRLAKALEVLNDYDVDHGETIEHIEQGPEAEAERRKQELEALKAFREHGTPLPKFDIPPSMSVSPVLLDITEARKVMELGGMELGQASASLGVALNQLAMDPRPEDDAQHKLLYKLVLKKAEVARELAFKASSGKDQALSPAGVFFNWLAEFKTLLGDWEKLGTKVDVIHETARRDILTAMGKQLSPYFKFSKTNLELATGRILT